MDSDPIELHGTDALADVKVVLHPSAATQDVTVTATRSSYGLAATANTVYSLQSARLADYPASALDDKLRQQPGFELFRRASSHIANPTSQGISLRALGSTAVSRTLVLADGVPLNDPFGGWIHWDEIPQTAVRAVDLAMGGGSDLYGSSALGGVIDVVPDRPTIGRVDASLSGGGEDTSLATARLDAGTNRLQEMLAGETFRTSGYIPTAPILAGPVDTPANVHYQNLRSETNLISQNHSRTFLIGNLLNEARNNGTSLQTNGTRLWRYALGEDWSAGTRTSGRARAFGGDEAYRQTFSSINAARTSETLTRLQSVHAQQLGASSDISISFSRFAVVAGADALDVRATDAEQPISAGKPNGLADTSARQRFVGGFGEVLSTYGKWSAALSLRLDSAQNLDTKSITQPSSLPQPVLTPNRSEFIASPRLGIVRQINSSTSIHASGFRAFRTPTMNELYRTGQVGQEITQANPQLDSERATGVEAGATYQPPSGSVRLSGAYFWTEINRPVSAVVLSTTPTSILEKRQNLGQIVSQGADLHLDITIARPLSATIGYQYANAVVTAFSAQPTLVGNWIPQVPRHSFAAQLRAASPALGEVTFAARASGNAFDDSANTYVLGSFVMLDLFARHDFGTHWTASVTLQNLLNQRPDVARTPILTLGTPFVAQGGLAFHWARATSN